MNKVNRIVVPWLVTFLLVAPEAWAQRSPQIGYVVPAGGQRGTAVEVTIGGQYLNGASGLHVSGDGIRASVLEYQKPLTQQEINALRQKLRELQKRVQAAATRQPRGRGGARARVPDRKIESFAREIGLEVTGVEEIEELRKKLFDPRRQLNPQLAETVVVRLDLDSGAVPGEREIRLVAAGGVSNPVSFHVGTWPEFGEKEPNDSTPEALLPAERPLVINGQILPGDVDRFRLRAHRGERLVLAVHARELIPYLADAVPGWFQATISLRDARGNEVDYADDFRFHPDPVLAHEVREDGEYEIEIRDAIYRGREDFVYRIEVGERPFVTGVFPLGARIGNPTLVKLAGWNLPVSELTLTSADGDPGIRTTLLARDGSTFGQTPFALDTLPEMTEREPNDEPGAAERVSLPRTINGRIDRAGDRDVFRFEGQAGEEVMAEVLARRLDSPVDSRLVLTDSGGRVIAANDDHEDRGAGLTTHHADSLLNAKLPAEGTYYVQIDDAQDRGGAEYAYRLRLGPPRPDFELRVVPSSVNARAGTTVPITVHALREGGFAGDIRLELEDAPPGFSLSGAWVPADREGVRLTLTVPARPEPEPVRLRLGGRATIGGQEIHREAIPADDRMQAFIYRHLVPAREWLVAIRGRGRSRSAVSLEVEEPVKLAAGDLARVRIQAPRGALASGVQLELSDPPRGVAIQRVASDPDGMAILLRVDDDEAQAGLRGNLIVNAFVERETRARTGKGKVVRRRVPLGTLPAIPFEIVRS